MSGDSPRSEAFPSRFSTPVNELDDHRNQPASLPRADTMANQHRRGTAGSTVDDRRPPALQVNGEFQTVSRDFEQAVYDDDGLVHGPEAPLHRRGSTSPVVARRPTHRRSHNEGGPGRSRESSSSGRSDSPPNSVEAFAGPRTRARAGTAGTLQSMDPVALRRTPSQSTFPRARTHSDDHGTVRTVASESDQGSVEDDVCFPQQDEPSLPFSIDFEDLQEFVARGHPFTPVPHPLRRQKSFSCRSQNARPGSIRLEGAKSKPQASHGILTHLGLGQKSLNTGITDSDSDDIVKEKDADDKDLERKPEGIHRWSFFSSELEESIYATDLGDLLMPGETFKHLFELGPQGGCWWLDMLMPTEEEVEVICKAFGIHGLTREDIIQQETREKVELFKSYYFVCFRSFYQMDKDSEDYLEPVNVYAVVFREGILTFTFCPSPHAANVRKRMGRLRDYIALSSDWICYALIDDIVDTFGPVIQEVERETDSIEDSVFTARAEDSRQLLRQIGECRKKVMSLLRLLGGKADVIKGFAKRCNEAYSVAPRSDVGLYLSDIQDHVVTMMGNLGHSDHMLSRSHANYLAQISVDNIAQGNRANAVLGKITFIATILVPLNLVCGLFGMNVDVPGKSAGGLGWFFGILGCLALFVVTAYVIARKKRLL